MFEKKDIIGTDVLDYLGLVAATIDKLRLVREIDKHLPMTQGAKTSHGQRAMAMILNSLGFMDDRLYLFPKFLENKPVAHVNRARANKHKTPWGQFNPAWLSENNKKSSDKIVQQESS